MRQYISHILSILLAICFVGCNEDIITSDNNDGNEHVYTLQLAISDSPATRSLTSVSVGSFKTRWCYGDKVTLKPNNSSTKYEFVIEVPAGKTMGDPVDDRVATFKYSDTAIPNFTNFTGSLNYDCGISKDNVITSGYTIDNNTKYENDNLFNSKIINVRCHPYALQSANNNADHLKCLDNLSHSFKNYDLSQPHVVSMSRDFSIIKIVLDDIYYPIYGGAMLFVRGFKKLVNGKYESANAGMVLGMGIVGTANDTSLYPPKSLIETNMQNPDEKGLVPFYAVPDQKDPLTGYAVRDEAHKLVAYMPVFNELEVCSDDNLEICLRDSWSLDSYFWTTGSLKPFKLPLGSVYTIDLTRKAGGRNLYESYAAINLGNVFSCALGNLSTRNMGAKSLTDTGEYYMFGHDKPIFPGGHYPKYPDITCYYYCQTIEGTNPKKVHIMYYNANGEAFKSEVEPPINGNFIGSTLLKMPGGEENRVDVWWSTWVKGLTSMPYQGMGMNWTLPGNTSVNSFKGKNINVLNEVVSVGGNPIGVRLSSMRTGHSVFIPISGVLEASEKDGNMRYIASDAMAGIKAGTERHAVLTGEPINIDVAKNTICISAYSFKIGDDNTTIEREKAFYELDVAGPVRPSLSEHEMLGALISAIPGY